MAKFLPSELLLVIFENCSDTDTLRSCCTVCRSWLPLSQPLLFERTNVFLGEEIPSLLSLVSSLLRRPRRSNRQLVSFIRQADCGSMGRLIKNVHVVFDSDTNLMPLPDLFPLLKNLQSLTLHARIRETIHPSSLFVAETTLTRLVLVNVMIRQFDKDILGLPNLQQLSMQYVTFSDWTQASAAEVNVSSPGPHLQALSIRTLQVHFDALVDHLLPHMIALRRLDVNCVDNQHLASDTLGHIVALNTETLEHLAIHQPVTSLALPRLHTLSLCSTPRVDVFLTYVHDTLTSIRTATTSMVDELILHLSGGYLLCDLGSHSPQWDGLQDLILSVARQFRLVMDQTMEDGLGDVLGIAHLSSPFVTVSDLQVHPSFERLRASGRTTFTVERI
ncbi:hypothetical protein CPB85DRAFT_188362 [Mucidula mucida]|nr:hypothetical protein CPB85DRAFT_188362 [Mucidula mucida]